MTGTLYLCATPIGNLEDMTLRVLRLLKECDLIAAEDTRQTLKLLNHFGITTPMTSYYEHNKAVKGPQLLKALQEGKQIALVTDAGMPGISDPGEDLVRLCYANDVPVTVAPGASAVVTAVVLSGLGGRRFVFEGFLPPEKKERAKVLDALAKEQRTTVFYEAPHHLVETLRTLTLAVGNRQACCLRELTKKFEERRSGTLSELLAWYEEHPPKGEFVIVVAGRDPDEMQKEQEAAFASLSLEEHMARYLAAGKMEKEAMKLVAKDRGVPKREIYAALKGHGKKES